MSHRDLAKQDSVEIDERQDLLRNCLSSVDKRKKRFPVVVVTSQNLVLRATKRNCPKMLYQQCTCLSDTYHGLRVRLASSVKGPVTFQSPNVIE